MTYTLTVHTFNPTDPRLGRHVHHDSRNRQYEHFTSSVFDLARTVQHHSNIPVLNQGNIGACAGFAGAGLMGYDRYFEVLSPNRQAALKTSGDATGLTFYHYATIKDSIRGTYPPDDTGSDGPSSCKGMTELSYANGYKHSFKWNTLLTALNVGPVMVGTTWYNSMFDAAGSEGTVNVDTRSGVAGGHEYVADGYDNNYVYFLNSWGTSYGKAGHFRIPVLQFQDLLADQGDVTVPVPATLPAPIPTPPAPAPAPVVDQDVKGAYTLLNNWAIRNNIK
ncbi:MAG: hypothetical protein ABR585_12540 [Gemmatimonadaceae bacterium]|nr:hypothetical protein [Actinomycetota bacterium]